MLNIADSFLCLAIRLIRVYHALFFDKIKKYIFKTNLNFSIADQIVLAGESTKTRKLENNVTAKCRLQMLTNTAVQNDGARLLFIHVAQCLFYPKNTVDHVPGGGQLLLLKDAALSDENTSVFCASFLERE
jgi:hypothetical protein